MLIKCKECGKEISSRAKECPNCGNIINNDSVIINCKKCNNKINLEDIEDFNGLCEKCYRLEFQNIENIVNIEKPVFSKGAIIYLTCATIVACWLFITYKDLINQGNFFIIFGYFCAILIFILLPLYSEISQYISDFNKYKLSNEDFEKYREKEIARCISMKKEQRKYNEELKYRIKCPNCNSTNVNEISSINRAISVSILGLASTKIGKTYQCDDCKYKW